MGTLTCSYSPFGVTIAVPVLYNTVFQSKLSHSKTALVLLVTVVVVKQRLIICGETRHRKFPTWLQGRVGEQALKLVPNLQQPRVNG